MKQTIFFLKKLYKQKILFAALCKLFSKMPIEDYLTNKDPSFIDNKHMNPFIK